MELEFKIPDLGSGITIKSGNTRFFNMLLLMECFLHYTRTRELIEMRRGRRGVKEISLLEEASIGSQGTAQ